MQWLRYVCVSILFSLSWSSWFEIRKGGTMQFRNIYSYSIPYHQYITMVGIWKLTTKTFLTPTTFTYNIVYFGTFFEQWDFWPFLSFHNICTFYANSQNVLKDFIVIINQCICKFKCLKTRIYQKVATHFVNVLGKVYTYM